MYIIYIYHDIYAYTTTVYIPYIYIAADWKKQVRFLKEGHFFVCLWQEVALEFSILSTIISNSTCLEWRLLAQFK